MNRIGRISLGMVALLALSGFATAKTSQPVAVAAAKPDSAVAATVPAPPSEIKPAKVAAKRNAAATETEPAHDPYAVPLFQQARPLKPFK